QHGRAAGHRRAGRGERGRPAARAAIDRQGLRRGDPVPRRRRYRGSGRPDAGSGELVEHDVMAEANGKLIRGATGDWEVIIGLEVHAQVTSKAKLFSGSSTEFGGEPNSHVSLVDAA